MKVQEYNSAPWANTLLNAVTLPVEIIHPVASIAWGFKRIGVWCFVPHVECCRDDRDIGVMWQNAIVFARVMFPFWIGVSFRWSGGPGKSYVQIGLGWKRNGRIAADFRVQSDASSAAGTYGPNVGQAQGWEYGDK